MTFQINDYNAFLSSLYDDNQPVRKDSFPIDFDFGLNQDFRNNNGLNKSPQRQNSVQLSAPGSEGQGPPLASIGEEVDVNDPNMVSQIMGISTRSPTLSPNVPPFDNYLDTTGNVDIHRMNNHLIHNNPNHVINNHGSKVQNPNRDDHHHVKLLYGEPYGHHHSNATIESEDDEKPCKRGKSSHNVIEQRYRNKINDKFTALQNSVPTLRVVARRKKMDDDDCTNPSDDINDDLYRNGNPNDTRHEYQGEYISGNEHYDDEEGELEGLQPARKLNKGIILSKSIEYIKFLELKNNRMKAEYNQLMQRAKLLGLTNIDQL